jgi:hypothetical protein
MNPPGLPTIIGNPREFTQQQNQPPYPSLGLSNPVLPSLVLAPPISQTYNPYNDPTVSITAPTQLPGMYPPTVPVQAPQSNVAVPVQTPSPNLEVVLDAFQSGLIPREIINRYADSIGVSFTDEMFIAGIEYIRENPAEFEPIYNKLVKEGLLERYTKTI